MENEMKNGFASAAKQIKWGNYQDYTFYKYYGGNIIEDSWEDPTIILAIGNELWQCGQKVGIVDREGHVSNFKPVEKIKARAWKQARESRQKKEETTTSAIGVDDVLMKALSRSVESLVGEKMSVDNLKFSD